MKHRNHNLAILEFSGYIGQEPVMVFNVDQDTQTMWLFPTEFAFEYIRLLAEGYRRN